ncbi:hypothetical protein G7Y89_g13758 [Cudoniella acicularis]|uniref:Uncharacterized protein n=1 Tax=Cudoniella acicularis TaxID=354080 RepID=A0A8H4R920_9HELO|nr:hypothetical protein G7Y89_g13758 [Cudoniella acicularis]
MFHMKRVEVGSGIIPPAEFVTHAKDKIGENTKINRNEARVVQDVTRLIVPSAEYSEPRKEPLRYAQIQGTFSYTVAVGTTKIFQFRVHDSSFDMQAMSLAKAVHPQFVPSCKYHGTLGQSRPLHIYEIENLPGTAYIIVTISYITCGPRPEARIGI